MPPPLRLPSHVYTIIDTTLQSLACMCQCTRLWCTPYAVKNVNVNYWLTATLSYAIFISSKRIAKLWGRKLTKHSLLLLLYVRHAGTLMLDWLIGSLIGWLDVCIKWFIKFSSHTMLDSRRMWPISVFYFILLWYKAAVYIHVFASKQYIMVTMYATW